MQHTDSSSLLRLRQPDRRWHIWESLELEPGLLHDAAHVLACCFQTFIVSLERLTLTVRECFASGRPTHCRARDELAPRPFTRDGKFMLQTLRRFHRHGFWLRASKFGSGCWLFRNFDCVNGALASFPCTGQVMQLLTWFLAHIARQ